jgi:AbrB family looped-hinge helix DNA binding protein
LIPKALRDALGLRAGSDLDISVYGPGLHITPSGRTARLELEDGVLVAASDTTVSDEDVVALIDAGRR